MEQQTILVVDDEEHIRELLSYNLMKDGYRVVTAGSGEEALELLNREEVNLLVLDLMLPGIDGIEVLKRIRGSHEHRRLPVLMLTAKGDEISKVIGLELGADDYLGKPFGIHELSARIKAIIRRTYGELSSEENDDTVRIRELVLDPETRKVVVRGREVELSRREFDLLYLLAKNKGRVYSRDQLLTKVWGYDFMGETRTVDVHVRNLRKKIEEDDTEPEYIRTVRGVGYKCE